MCNLNNFRLSSHSFWFVLVCFVYPLGTVAFDTMILVIICVIKYSRQRIKTKFKKCQLTLFMF